MDWQAWFSLGLTVSVLASLILLPRLSADAALMAALVLLCVTGILTPEEALAGFSNPGLVTVGAMFVVAAGIKSAGGVDIIVNSLLGRPGGLRRALVRMMAPVALLSGFMNNTPVVATMIPAVSQWARKIRLPTSALMIPLSYASILGGTLTIIGTSTNLVVNGQYQALTGAQGFGLFDITPIGLAVLLLGTVFIVLVSPMLLRERRSPEQTFADTRKFTFEVAVAMDGPLVGKSIQQAGLRNLQKIFLAEIERDDRILGAVGPQELLRGGDRLVFVGETDAIVDVLRINGLVPAVGSQPSQERKLLDRKLIEAVVAPQCEAIGRTIRAARFRDRYGAVVLAVARNGEHIRGRLSSIIVQAGDVLLLETSSGGVTGRLRNSRDFLLINELNHELPDHSRAWLSWGILGLVVALAATGITSMLNASLLGAALMVLCRCLRVGDARRSLDLAVLITIAASFALGVALQKTGAAAMIAESLTSVAGHSPLLLLVVSYFSVMLLTEMITNNAAAVLMLPVVLAMAESAGLNQAPFVIAVMFAASASFATPLGYQCNLMVYGPGGYRFSDFLRIGVPMNLLVAAITLTLLPLLYPLT